MRIAWFSPLPPVQSGIADYSAELLPRLAGQHEITAFVASPPRRGPSLQGVSIASAHDFVWRHQRQRWDLIVYQLGNGAAHDYTWPYLFQYPGLTVLHDAHLHQARAFALLSRGRRDDYRAELRFNHPDVAPGVAEIGLAGFGGAVAYFWPMLRSVATSARVVAVHNSWVADELAVALPGTRVHQLRMGVRDPWAELEASARPPAMTEARRAVRARHGWSEEDVVLAAFGGITPEKRLGTVLKCLAALRPACPRARLMIVGRKAPYYDLRAAAVSAGVEDLVTIIGYVPDEELPSYLVAADVALCLRWPTTGETSASWLRCIAAGLPTITTDLVHEADRPSLDPRTWTVVHGTPAPTTPEPVGVSIDILDEEHSLGLAVHRLVVEHALRDALGRAARRYWRARHTLDHMLTDYDRTLVAAASAGDPKSQLPPHMRSDGMERTRELLAPFGLRNVLARP